MTDGVDDFFAHFGIKGMRWGIRKKTPMSTPDMQAKVNRLNLENQHQALVSPKKTKAATGPWATPVRTLSDKELAQRISRLKMEKQYKDLTKRDLTPAEKAAKDIAMAFATSAASKAGEATVNWATGGHSSGSEASGAYATAMIVKQVMGPMVRKAITQG